MWLLSTYIAGGALFFTGRKIYKFFQKNPVDSHKKNSSDSNESSTENAQFKSASKNIRSQQFKELSGTGQKTDINESEKKADKKLLIALSSVGLVTAGSLMYPPFFTAAVPGLLYLAWNRLNGAFQALYKERKVRIIVIDSLWIVGALISGYYFWVALGCGIYHLGEKLLAKTEDHSRKSLMNIYDEPESSAWILIDEAEIEIPVDELKIGDVIIVDGGQVIPVDGKIVRGMASVDQQRLTGEEQPAEKGIGDPVMASTVVLSGRIYIQVEKTGEETAASQIRQILNQTANFKLSIQSKGEVFTDKSALPTLMLSSFSLPFVGPNGALALLGNYPGANLRLLAPMTMLNFLHIVSWHGILVKDGRSLEQLENVDTIVFDKTGTLTLSKPQIYKIYSFEDFSEDEVLSFAATAEQKQTHPIADAIVEEAKNRNLAFHDNQEIHYEAGYGIKIIRENDKTIQVGSDRFMEMEGIVLPSTIDELKNKCHSDGNSIVMVAVNGQFAGAIELQPTIRPEARDTICELKKRGYDLYIISGDQEQPTKTLAKNLGIENYYANTLPENKAQLIEQLQLDKKVVCFIGDGINDSLALSRADVSISLCGASTIATDTAQIVLMDTNLNRILDLFDITQNMQSNMKNNIITSLIPGVMGIGGVFFFNFGFVSSIVLYNFGLFAGISNTMLPILKQTSNKQKSKYKIKSTT
ncbi:heavy metal translocating P-type ATPase [Desulfobacterales bacterium HSG16]|nr:heavy metal translocating P-type ATPase [Desulfobacterales bacterium HSG16]